ncbi:Protein of unknown function DUF604 [Dillenia turbinata]|uniref:Uncharacterized protein n=1 Tax=Dillenia turbinata TaxID=194707 RepID=A0AAN8VX18_9MAGN
MQFNEKNNLCCRSPSRRSRRSHNVTTAVIAVLALVISILAWLFFIVSCFSPSRIFQGGPNSLSLSHPYISYFPNHVSNDFTTHVISHAKNDDNIENNTNGLLLEHIVFGIGGSKQLWNTRKEFVKLWWRPNAMRGFVWLEEKVGIEENDDSLPPIMISEDISRFRYTHPTGNPSGLRISRIVSECFRLGLEKVRWFVLCDDDTIFNVDNLVQVLSKYDDSEMVYVGSPSESHSANAYFSHSMAFGGGGIAISWPLAEALFHMQDDCLERYPKLYGSDDRLHACITELGIPLSREHGFHQWDIRGSAHGLLAAHPIAPFVSIHHVEAVDPFYPGLSSLDSLKLFARAMNLEPMSFLQRAICFDHTRSLTFMVSLGYVVQLFPHIVLPRELERAELTYSAWNKIRNRNEFDLDIRDPHRSVCKKPVQFFLKDVGREGNYTTGLYKRTRGRDDMRRKVFCFPRQPPLHDVQHIEVIVNSINKNWHLVPRRLCCELNYTSGGLKLALLCCALVDSKIVGTPALGNWRDYCCLHLFPMKEYLITKLRS